MLLILEPPLSFLQACTAIGVPSPGLGESLHLRPAQAHPGAPLTSALILDEQT